MKKIGLFMTALIAMFTFTFSVSAKDVATKEDFIAAIAEGGEVKITESFVVDSRVEVTKDVTLDLNGKEVGFTASNFLKLSKGNLNVTGSGLLYEVTPTFGPIVVKGSTNASDTNYATLTVGKDVKLKGWAGIFIDKYSNTSQTAYGVTVNFYGTIEGLSKADGDLSNALYLNGSIADTTNAPVINVYEGSKITSTGHGIYGAGYATYNIYGGTITGYEAGIEIRAGKLNVTGGTITATYIPTSETANGNGSTLKGVGIGVAQHNTKLPINVNITGGKVDAYIPFYEANPQKNSADDIAKITLSINGGTFTTISNSTQVVYSEDKEEFVKKGTFNKEVDKKYLEDTSISKESGDNYVIAPNVVTEKDGVTFESSEAFSNNYVLLVEEASEDLIDEANEKLKEAYKNNKEVKDVTLINLYDINMLDGQEIVPMEDGTFTISIEVPENMRNFKTYTIIYLDEDGNIAETIEAKLVDNKIVFTTTHLSVYGIVGYNDAIKNPETSDNIMKYIALGILSIATISAVVLKKQY